MDHTNAVVGNAKQQSNGVGGTLAIGTGNLTTDSVAAFAHEIRTPLATINATLELLQYDPSPGAENLRQLVARLQRGVIWITNLVDNLNTWSQMRDGVLALNRSETIVREWIEQAMTLVQPILERREQTMLLACPKPSPVIVGDSFRLSQVMANLLTNASRYGAWGDTIAITVIEEQEAVAVHVSDHGPGIPADECEKIFAPGVRGSRGAELAGEGQGLGLSIVAGIVEIHGGTVGVDSVPGRGTTFTVRLPVQPQD